MCFTLADLAPSFSSGNNLIHVFLNTTRTFIVFVHDPKFFVYTYNPQAIPMTTWILPKTKMVYRYRRQFRGAWEKAIELSTRVSSLKALTRKTLKQSLSKRVRIPCSESLQSLGIPKSLVEFISFY